MALMSHYKDALELQTKSTNSAGEAMKRYQTYAQSTKAKLEDLKGSIQRFWTQTTSSKEVNQIVDDISKLFNAFSSLSGKIGIVPTLLTGIVPILTQFDKFKDFKPIDLTSSIGSIKIFGKSMGDAKNSFNSFTESYTKSLKAIQEFNGTMVQTPTLLERTKASMNALKSTTVATTIATGTLKAMEIALNAAITMGISIAIGVLIQKLGDYINKVDTLKQKNQELIESTNQSIQEHQSNVSMLSEMSAKYGDVYDRIQTYKDRGLTPLAEDTKALNDMNNNLAQKFPDLVTGYTDTGEAVLNLNGNLKDLIDTEKEKAKQDAQKVINDSGFKEESEVEQKQNNDRMGYLNQSYGAGNFIHNIKTAFTDPKTYFQRFTTDNSQKAKMTAQLNKENEQASEWYKKKIPDILKIDEAYQKLNPTLQTAIKNWAMQNKEFSKASSGKDIQKQVNAVSKLYTDNDSLKLITQLNRLTKEAKSGALPLEKYTKDTDELIDKIKQISDTSLSKDQLKKVFNVDTSKISQDITKINSLNKSVKEFKSQFTTDVQQINKYNKVLSDIQNTGKVSSANKKLIEQDPELLPYLGDVNTLVEKINEKIGDLKTDSKTAFANSQLKEERDQLSSLEDTYVKLASKTDLTAEEKKKLADTTAQLKSLVPGLIDVTNGDTDAIDKNKQKINEKIADLDTEGNYIALVAQVGQDAANKRIQAEMDSAQKTITESQKRIDAYSIEMKILHGFVTWAEKLPFGIGDKVKNSVFGTDLKDYDDNVKKVKEAKDKLKSLENEKAISKQENINWDDYKKATSAVIANTNAQKENNKSQQNGTDTTNENTDAQEQNTKAMEDNTATMDRAKEIAREYELQISSLDNTIKKQENTVNNYAKGSEKRNQAILQEIELIKQENGVYEDIKNNADSVSSMNSIVANQSGSAVGKQIVTNAEKYLNTPYVWGGTSPQGFDCSGLVQYVYKQVGISLNRTSQEQFKQGTPVSKANLQPGDLVFFKSSGSASAPGHVGIYAGDGKYIQAPKRGDVVKISNLNGRSDYVGGRRIVSGGISDTSVTSSKLTYADIVKAAAQKYGVNANLIAGVIQQESNWDANIKSSAGAMGLMQLMPGTAQSLGVKDAYNPYQNVMGGVALLSRLLKKYNGNQALALAAYNAGEGNVAKYGGVPPFRETQDYIGKVLSYASEYTNEKRPMPTTSVSGVLSEEQSMAQQAEEAIGKIEDNAQKMKDLYKDWYENHIAQYDNQTKVIDNSISKLQDMKDLDGENDNSYIAVLKNILNNTNSKIGILRNEQNYITSQLKNPGGVYTDAVLQEMQEKYAELTVTIKDVEKAVKEAGYAWAQSKFDNITDNIQKNLTLIENSLNRLDNASTVDLTSKLNLQEQKVKEDQAYIQQLTDLLRELNEEEVKTGSAYLFDKIKEFNAELDKAKTTLTEDNKAIQDIKNSMADLTSTILDKIKTVIQKNNELFKDELDKNLKLFEDAVDKEVNKLEEAKKKLDNNETNYTDIQNINDLQRQLNAIQGNDIASKAQRDELQKQLDEANKQFASDTMNQNIQDREDALNKAKDDYEKLEQSYIDAIDKSNDDANLNKQANQALIGGYLLDSNGNKVDLGTALKNYEDQFGEGLTVLGNKIKTELIDQLKEVQDLMNEFGTLDTTKINSDIKVKTVYGTGVDLENAKSILGAEGYNYVDTSWTPANEINPQYGDVVLGGSVSNDKLKGTGATNLTGSDRYKTELMLQMYSDATTGKIPYIYHYTQDVIDDYVAQNGVKSKGINVYGSGIDLENAKKLLGKYGVNFVDTNDVSNIQLGSNDIVIGGAGVMKGTEKILTSGAQWLWGSDREDTLKLIQDLANEFTKFPVNTTGYAEGGDVDFTGLAMVHGSKSEPETIFNYKQGQGLHSSLIQISNAINKQLENNTLSLNNSPMVQDYNDTMAKIKNIMDNNINKSNNSNDNIRPIVNNNINIDKVYGQKDVGEELAKDALNYWNKLG